MQTSNNTTVKGIHCKINYNDQIRRFHFVGTEFISLKETIARLFSLNVEFVLKYTDDEKELITLERQEDYITALQICPDILRITIHAATVHQPMFPSVPYHGMSVNQPVFPFVPCRGMSERAHYQHGSTEPVPCHGIPVNQPMFPSVPCHGTSERAHFHRKFHHHGGCKGRHHFTKGNGGCSVPDHVKLRFEQKLIWINLCLEKFSLDEAQLTPWEAHSKQRLMKKKERITAFLSGQPYHKPELSPESMQYNEVIHRQIMEKKNEMHATRGKIREVKILLQTQVDDKDLLEKLAQLKELNYQLKSLIRSLFLQLKSQ